MKSSSENPVYFIGKIMTSALLLSLLLYFTPAFAAEPAQGKKSSTSSQQSATKGSKDPFDMMAARLELTEKQKNDLKPLLQKLKTERAETLKKLDEKQHKELLTILNEDQSQKIGQFLKRADRMDMMGRGTSQDDRKPMGMMGQERKPQILHPRPPATLPAK